MHSDASAADDLEKRGEKMCAHYKQFLLCHNVFDCLIMTLSWREISDSVVIAAYLLDMGTD